jgi:hypothetical protein
LRKALEPSQALAASTFFGFDDFCDARMRIRRLGALVEKLSLKGSNEFPGLTSASPALFAYSI